MKLAGSILLILPLLYPLANTINHAQQSKSQHKECDKCANPDSECNTLKIDPVCGANGLTYSTMCHASKCGGLKVKHITSGTCESKNSCGHRNPCKSSKVCIPWANGPCLTIYTPRGRKLPCQQYTCVPSSICASDSTNAAQVCGSNGQTYSDLCALHKSRVQLDYTGPCRPEECSGEVCGSNGMTYKSACHAKSSSIRIDYNGKCYRESYDDVMSCEDVRRNDLCPKVSCSSSIIPEGACCPICGGSMVIELNLKALENSKQGMNYNHFYHAKSLIRRLVPMAGGSTCTLYAMLTEKNTISVVLEAVQSTKATQQCHAAIEEMLVLINEVHKIKALSGNVFLSARSVAAVSLSSLDTQSKSQVNKALSRAIEFTTSVDSGAVDRSGASVATNCFTIIAIMIIVSLQFILLLNSL